MIHGVPNTSYDINFHNKLNDWTEGCIALENARDEFFFGKILRLGHLF